MTDRPDPFAFVRVDLAAFGALAFPGFELPAHVELLVTLLEQMERGDVMRALLALPPRHGKTRLCVETFIPWLLGRDPTRNVIFATHSSDYAEVLGRRVRNLMMTERYLAAFPSARLSGDSAAAARFDLTAGGSFVAVGRGQAAAMGRGGHFVVLDDVLKGSEEARSAATRQSVREWYSTDIHTRLEPDARLLVIGTRWHMADLQSFLEREHGHEGWKVINLPALAEENDLLGREPDEALWPSRYPVERLKLIRMSKSVAEWSALYQGRPIPEGGAIFREEWLRGRFNLESLPNVESLKVIQSWDCSYGKSAASGDFSACATIAASKTAFYILHVFKARLDFPSLKRKMQQLANEWDPDVVLVEDTVSGTSAIQELQAETNLALKAIKAPTAKEIRFEAVSPLFESGKVFFQEGAAWLSDVIPELMTVPAAPHDDQTDAIAQGLTFLRGSRLPGQGVVDFYERKTAEAGGD